LQSWGIARVTHVLGDRRDHFESLGDVWEMFRIILDERKHREIDPTLELLRECVADARAAGRPEKQTHDRLKSLLGFFESMDNWYRQIRKLPLSAIRKFVKLGGRVARMLGVKG
jgi:DNA-binding transcriptional regulator GbsR (MarR family)